MAKKEQNKNKDDKNEKKAEKKSTPAGRFTKGHKKVGGRAKGTPNKVTGDMRSIIEKQLRPHIEKIGETIKSIKDPAQKAAAIAQWNQYLMPKYSNTTINADTRRDISTEEFISQLNGKYDKSDINIDISTINIINNG
ncbi:MAG: hypothetical protein IKW98_08885 [Prevotella sp.]|nr:hypothetical protein [Prevotella sp.]